MNVGEHLLRQPDLALAERQVVVGAYHKVKHLEPRVGDGAMQREETGERGAVVLVVEPMESLLLRV